VFYSSIADSLEVFSMERGRKLYPTERGRAIQKKGDLHVGVGVFSFMFLGRHRRRRKKKREINSTKKKNFQKER